MRISNRLLLFFILISFFTLKSFAVTEIPDYSGKYFELSFIDALSGEFIDTKEMSGKIIVVNFWFSECSPCQDTTPYIRSLYEKYSSENACFIGINMDTERSMFLEYCNENQITWPQFFEENKKWDTSVAIEWDIAMTPMFFVINTEGIIIENTVSTKKLENIIKNEIREKTKL